MSVPMTTCTDPILAAMNEIMSGMSALNMPPDPIPKETLGEDDMFLSDTDRMASHAIDHLHAALTFLNKAHREVDKLKLDLKLEEKCPQRK